MDQTHNINPDVLKIDWRHSKIYHDWTIHIKLPRGPIHGVVSFTNPGTDDYSVWGTMQIGTTDQIAVHKYNNPPSAIDMITRSIIAIMAQRIIDSEGNPMEL